MRDDETNIPSSLHGWMIGFQDVAVHTLADGLDAVGFSNWEDVGSGGGASACSIRLVVETCTVIVKPLINKQRAWQSSGHSLFFSISVFVSVERPVSKSTFRTMSVYKWFYYIGRHSVVFVGADMAVLAADPGGGQRAKTGGRSVRNGVSWRLRFRPIFGSGRCGL